VLPGHYPKHFGEGIKWLRRFFYAIPRKTAKQILNDVPGGLGYETRVETAIECAMNIEWWRGYYAAQAERDGEDISSILERVANG
jgi:hypothetical protein